MRQHNAESERVKREYLIYLKAAKGLSEASLDTVVKAIHRFEVSTKFRSFRKFHVAQAIAFRRQLSETDSSETGKPLSKATVLQTLNALRAFFFVAGRTAGLPVADQLFRRGLFPPFREGHADRQSRARATGADSGANPGRARRHAARHRDRPAQPCPDRLYAHDRCARWRTCLAEAQARRPRGGKGVAGRPGGKYQVLQDLHDMVFPGGR